MALDLLQGLRNEGRGVNRADHRESFQRTERRAPALNRAGQYCLDNLINRLYEE